MRKFNTIEKIEYLENKVNELHKKIEPYQDEINLIDEQIENIQDSCNHERFDEKDIDLDDLHHSHFTCYECGYMWIE